MREISPAVNLSADKFLATKSSDVQDFVQNLRNEKNAGTRPLPSHQLIDNSVLLTKDVRISLIDKVATLVDENLFGRSEMCIQFSLLLNGALKYFNLKSRCAIGTAIYFDGEGNEMYRWQHVWVRIGMEVVDGNTDTLNENPQVPKMVNIPPYWGPINKTPNDRRLQEDRGRSIPQDEDVQNIWWPELLSFLEEKFPIT